MLRSGPVRATIMAFALATLVTAQSLTAAQEASAAASHYAMPASVQLGREIVSGGSLTMGPMTQAVVDGKAVCDYHPG